MDTSQIKPLRLDDIATLSVGGTANSDDYRSRTGILNGQSFPLDILADNIDLLNNLSTNTRWMMIRDDCSVPHDYRWTTYRSLGDCHSIAQGRALAAAKEFAEPLLGQADIVLINHVEEQRMEVIALFEHDTDAVYDLLQA